MKKPNLLPQFLYLRKIVYILLFLSVLNTPLVAQTDGIKISGTVTDTKKEPLIGVSILLKGTNKGTLTDINGKYSITVPNGQATLQFFYTGFNREETTVNKKTTINVIMTEAIKELNEIIIVGYGANEKTRCNRSYRFDIGKNHRRTKRYFYS